MTFEEYLATMFHFRDSGLIFPYGVFPGWFNGGIAHVGANETFWRWYRWNPPMFTGHRVFDPKASHKPRWDYLQSLARIVKWNDTVAKINEDIDKECMQRFLKLYGVRDESHLPILQLAGRVSSAQQVKGAKLLDIDKDLRIEILDLGQKELEKYDVSDPAKWVSV